jgi:mannose-6-phosphate isomerase-like protein (cupin superfamily)
MKNSEQYINSGILESYVLGLTGPKETSEIEQLASQSADIRKRIDEISEALEEYAMANAISPDPTIKPFVFAIIDYTERMEAGEQPSEPPVLNEASRISDYADWLNKPGMSLPQDFNDLYAKIIGYTPKVLTAIVWINDMAPQEVHHDELEKFLIVEGECDIVIGEEVHHLVPGNYLSIPLHKNHRVQVTSSIPCKVILQRVAA